MGEMEASQEVESHELSIKAVTPFIMHREA